MADYAQISNSTRGWVDGGTTTEKTLVVVILGDAMIDIRTTEPATGDLGVPVEAGTVRDSIELPSGVRWWHRQRGAGVVVINRVGLGV